MSSATGDQTAILARASEKSREALGEAEDEASAWVEAVRSGAMSADKACVTCGRGPPLQDNHVAGRRHGDLTVPMCPPCHRRFTEGQDSWDPRWASPKRTPDLDMALLLLGLRELLLLRARQLPDQGAAACLSFADSLREQYARVARGTV